MFQLVRALVCDAVTLDSLGKYNCFGIYPRGIIFVDHFSAPINVSFYVEILTDRHGPVPMQFQIEDRLVGRVYQSFDATLEMSGPASSPIYGGPYSIHAAGPSVIIFSAIAEGQRIDLATIYLNQASPTALLPPSGRSPPDAPPTF